MQAGNIVRLFCAFAVVWPLSASCAAAASTGLIVPSGLSGAVGSWSGAGWYIYWPSSNNPINAQLHRGPYSAEDQCQADLKKLTDQEVEEDRATGTPVPAEEDRCAYFGVQPKFDQPFN